MTIAVKKENMKVTHPSPVPEWTALVWSGAFLMAILGFSGWAGTTSWIVQILMLVFALLFLFSFISFRSPH